MYKPILLTALCLSMLSSCIMRMPFDYDNSKVSKGKIGTWLRGNHQHFSELIAKKDLVTQGYRKDTVIREYSSQTGVPDSLAELDFLIRKDIEEYLKTTDKRILQNLGFSCNFPADKSVSCYLRSEFSMVFYNSDRSPNVKKEDRYYEITEINLKIDNNNYTVYYKTTFIPRTFFK